jgi:hypothetical protein
MSRLSDACGKELRADEKLTLRCQLLKSWRRLLLFKTLHAVMLARDVNSIGELRKLLQKPQT